MIARVAIVPPAGRTGLLDYAVDPSTEASISPGVRVLVPLGARRAVGVVSEIVTQSAYPRLKTVLAVLDQPPLIDAALLQLCRWMAEYYLCSLADALSTALPGSMRLSIQRLACLTEAHRQDPDALAALGAADRELIAALLEHRAVAIAKLKERFGASVQARLLALQSKGWVRIEQHLEGGGQTKRQRYYQAERELSEPELREWRRRRPAQLALYAYLQQHPLRRAGALELRTTFPKAAAQLKALAAAGVVRVSEEEVYRSVLPEVVSADNVVELNEAQRAAVDAIAGEIGRQFSPALLWGVTGSGKTEVYLRCIALCLAAQRTALVLVPEISLTHQLVDRVRARFGNRVAILHSGLSDGERWDEWRKIARAEVSIVVGARSAVFAPAPQLGLVIVDEEHDPAFKQDDGIRYNGRDVAVMRAKLAGCPVLLGSATPAMETFHNACSGRYQLLTLPERVEARPLPSVQLIDLRRSSSVGKALLISPPLAAALKANLAAHGQSLLFLNRRGFANFLQCHQCGETLSCPNCSVTLTLHRRWQALRCHHCDHTIPIPHACPSCAGLSLAAWGAGTEQVEAALRKLIPGARVGRMDRDTTSRRGSVRAILGAWERREYDILVGTQMVTKGHDVPGVTLVGVLLADLSLNLPDFRSAERTFQLLTQVAGRAGRGSQPGRVLVQTMQPNHVSLQCALHHDFRQFAEQELAARRETGYPPFTRMVQLRCDGEDAEATQRIVRAAADHLREIAAKGIGILGPAPSPLERVRRRFRWQLLIRSTNGVAARRAAAAARDAVRDAAKRSKVRVLVDVDPYSML